MKKSILLLLFVASTLMASAMTGPVKTFDPQKIGVDSKTVVFTPEAACMVCAECQGVIVCFIAFDCDKAGSGLTALLEVLGCLSKD